MNTYISNQSPVYSAYYLPGVKSPFYHTPYAQWKAMSEYIRGYIESHPSLLKETQVELLGFNAQYLVKIADYPKDEVTRDQRDVSPLNKWAKSYHRDYRKDNRLLWDSTLLFQTIFADGKLYFASHDSYIYFLKNMRSFSYIKSGDTDEKITQRIQKQLSLLDKSLSGDLASILFVHIDGGFDILSQDRRVPHVIDIVKTAILNYPFKVPMRQTVLLRTLGWSASYNLNHLKLIVIDENNPNTGGSHETAIRHSGSAPTLQESGQMYAKANLTLDDFYSKTCHETDLKLEVSRNIERFVTPPCTQSMEILAKGPLHNLAALDFSNETSLMKIVGQAVLHLLQGLQTATLDLAAVFENLQLNDLLHDSIRRINQYLEELLFFKEDNIRVGNFTDLIIEEIGLLLLLAKPYKENDLENIFLKEMIPSWLKPKVIRFNHSGTQCSIEILQAIMQMNKKRNEITHIMYFSDIYFEVSTYINRLAKRESHEKCLKVTTHVVDTIDDYDGSMIFERITLYNSKSLNCLFIDPHPSAQGSRRVQHKHNIIEIIEILNTNKIISDNFTVVIDNTIGSWDSEEINRILTRFRNEIQGGRFHFIIYKSLHKLDILGSDKFNGGNYIVYTAENSGLHQSINKFPSTMTMEGMDYQAYCHFYQNISLFIKAYYKKIAENASILYKSIDPKWISTADRNHPSWNNPPSFWISNKQDEGSTYVEVNFPNKSEYLNPFLKVLHEIKWIHDRDSFGYRETTMLKFESKDRVNLRFTAGLEEEEVLQNCARLLNKVFESVM